MADNEIKIIIGSDTSGLDDGAKKAVKALDNVKKASGSATYALTNLGRVVQDAPFGFIGIANNIDPLLSSFQQLKKESGSVGGALKSLGSSLLGGGGISLAVSLATSALVVFGDKLFSTSEKTDTAAESAKKYKEEVDAIKDSVTKEAISVERLVRFANDENTSRADRLAAIKKLKDIAPEYFGTLNAEKTTVQELSNAYSNFSSNIQNTIRAKLFGKQLEDVTKKRLDLEEKIYFVGEEEVAINGKLVKVRNVDMRTQKEKLIDKNKYLELLNQEKQLIDKINSLTKPIEGESKANEDLLNKRKKAAEDAAKEQRKIEEEQQRERLARLERVKIASEKITLKGLTVDIDPGKIGDLSKLFGKGNNAVLKQIEALQAAGKQVNDTFVNIGNTITQILAPAFQSAFDSILSGSQNAFQAFGQAIAGVIKKLIAAAATAALLAVIIGVATGGTNFGAGVGAEVGNFSAGFKALFSQLGGFKFADGGIVTGPTRALIGEAGPEAVIPLSKLDNIVGGNQNIFVTGVLSGENIYLQQQRTSARRSRFV